MFERFTGEARRSIVLAQEEARRLLHNYIGTEHLLLGLIAEESSVAAQVAGRFGITLQVARDDVLAIIGLGKKEPRGHIPFTPRAKKCLELALREALQLGHNYIGTEHILLGIVREGEGVAVQMLLKHGADHDAVRAAVLDLIPPEGQGSRGQARYARRWLRSRAGVGVPSGIALRPEHWGELRTTPAADTSLAEAARLAGPNAVASHHILLAALADPDTTVARALVALGMDLDRAREALRTADVTGSSDELPEDAGRRQLTLTVTDARVVLEASDPEIVKAGRAALEAIRQGRNAAQPAGAGAGESAPGDRDAVIRGDHPFSTSLAAVWAALHDSLDDIRRKARAAAEEEQTPPTPPTPPAEAAGDA